MIRTINKDTLEKIIVSKKVADQVISQLGAKQLKSLEEKWDVEHAYYSSALEGSNLDKEEFDQLAKSTK